ncbi:MAG: hypothetical protein DWQ36_03270 [Acidobacteria bacterium]|nr:MAG: hypothetical protein DWQ30_17000 [Acidobacteriota bacterium]REK10986.1 MAG: hypothetical protein DWQ36_03270 [Acidobacteriota bacterium]
MIPRPDQATEKQLRGFALLLPVALLLVAWLLSRHFAIAWDEWATWGYAVAGLLVAWSVVGALLPRTIRPLYLLLGWATWPIGLVLSTLLVALLFYAIVTPIGFALRLSGRDPLSLRRGGRTTMWHPRPEEQGKKRYARMW